MQDYQRLLIVDDDPRLRSLLERYLADKGFQIRCVVNTEQMDRMMTRESYNLVILDLILPGEDGLSACRRIRACGNDIPIIFLSALGSEDERIRGLEAGADDYLCKPFNPRELHARIKTVLRRQVAEPPGAPSPIDKYIEFGGFRFSLGSREIFKGEKRIPLTSGEFAVLKALVTHPRESMSRDKLMHVARGREYSALERSIDVQVSRLRRLIEIDHTRPRYIQTVWGLGYVFVPDGEKI
ncbi:osmolarity response regulator transcription factor OmpR [Vibrio sp. SCSIO 43137]|uniref:osmolarity response regulator transcription factor OmpR n=1 Tax=Vibrio sp. SCSIO 43137 TaxID=3021011 RepID=UPI0023071695|nr:two-component system response regulator OmpR [Vibrio sp. SCSIO 43137]WCE29551.1 two-component system response regulator OmpR [Vibrio sp. SCSIO 43137]